MRSIISLDLNEIDENKIFLYCVRILKFDNLNEREKYTSIMNKIYNKKSLIWRPEFHKYWVSTLYPELNKQITCLLLVSKNRNISKKKEAKFMAKGVTMIIIKHLCHSKQTKY